MKDVQDGLELYAKKYEGKLLLRDELDLDDRSLHKFFTPNPSIQRKNIYTYQCNRCGNSKHYLFGKIPCERCKTTHAYCRKCIEMGRVLMCESLYEWSGPNADWEKYVHACTWQGELTALQQKAADRIVEALDKKEKELLVWAVCGAGKTEMLFPGMSEAFQQGKRICLATPSPPTGSGHQTGAPAALLQRRCMPAGAARSGSGYATPTHAPRLRPVR